MIDKSPLLRLREEMEARKIAACIIPTGDPHISEYTGDHYKQRDYYSGFDGSAGTLVVTMSGAGLWTDGRYYVQAASQIKGRDIELFRAAEEDCIKIPDYLGKLLSEDETVYVSGRVYSAKQMKELEKELTNKGLRLETSGNMPAEIQENRPPEKLAEMFVLEEKYSGMSTADKLEQTRRCLREKGADALIMGKLDPIAWLFNLRGADIHCTPFFIAYAYVSLDEAVLFTNTKRVPDAVKEYLKQQSVKLMEYDDVFTYVRKIGADERILCDLTELNYSLYTTANTRTLDGVIEGDNPIMMLKAVKNKTEIENQKRAYRQDGATMVRFFAWLFGELEKGNAVTEYEAGQKVGALRMEQEGCVGESFGAIAAYAANAAMCHYHPEEGSCATINPEGMFLLDNGGQYLYGTTDTTRTVKVGALTDEMKKHFTLCLKGVIALSEAVFIGGTTGRELDILARQYLWKSGLNYRHGTGHGIGYMLSVHEGPHGFGPGANNQCLKEGMVISIEPGFYEEGSHGIRIENIAYVAKGECTEYGQFYRFETFTVVPIDTECIDLSLLTRHEVDWLNSYHQRVYDSLKDMLEGESLAYLEQKTKPVAKVCNHK